jgi:Cu2+-exporting ATPase
MNAPAPQTEPKPDWLEFSEDLGHGRFASRVRVAGIHCAACAGTIAHHLQQAGVESAEINSATGRARVVWQIGQTEPSRWMQAAERSGYTMAAIAGVDWLEITRQARRRALWRWLVAGFCTMQAMMLMWPFYGFSGDWGGNDLDAQSAALLRWGMLMLSIPVLLFSSGDFFRAAWRDLMSRRISMDLPVALGIAITFIVSCVATFAPQSHWGALLYFDSLTMFVFILLSGRWLEAHLRVQTAGALDAITAQTPQRADRVQADGSVQNIPLSQLQVGDVVRVLAGQLLPADGVVLQGQSWVDEALLTGESKPVAKQIGSAVVAGSSNQSQTLLLRVEKVGADTRYAQIVALMERAAEDKPQLMQLADRLAQPFLLGVVLLAATAFFWWAGMGQAQRGVVAAINVLIITCPCALALAAPAALLAATAALARQGILPRQIGVIERLAQVQMALFDKTGTLSLDNIAVVRTQTFAAYTEAQVWGWARQLAAHSLHPASRALLAGADGAVYAAVTGVSETAGQGLEGQLRLADSDEPVTLRLGRADWCGIGADAQAQQLGGLHSGMRVWLSANAQAAACFELEESLRPDAAGSLQTLRNLGLRLGLLSGDTASAVERIGQQLPALDISRAACSPQDKLAQLQMLQAQGQPVLMVGDGINDGPVLAGAHVSMAMAGAAPLAQVRADALLLRPDLGLVPLAIGHSRRAMQVLKQNLAWALAYNAVAIPLAFAGFITPWIASVGMACSSLLVLANAARLAKMPKKP